MKKQLLFIHGAGEGAYIEDKKLAENLELLLGSSFQVRYPQMENENDAPYKQWTQQIQGELKNMSDDVILVGHSVGASILIKFIMENKIARTVSGIFLIAAPYWGKDGGWTYDGYEELVLPEDSQSQLRPNIPLFIYHSDNDEVVPFAHLSRYASRFPQATPRAIPGRGHQLDDDLSEVATDIAALT